MPPKTRVWSDIIADVSDTMKPDLVDLLNPNLTTSTYNVDTGTYVTTGNPVVATNVSARIQPFRVSVDVGANGTGNPSGEIRVRVQIPRTSVTGRIQRGWQVRVVQSERTPDLDTYLFYVDSVVNSSWRASITLECTVNLDNEVSP